MQLAQLKTIRLLAYMLVAAFACLCSTNKAQAQTLTLAAPFEQTSTVYIPSSGDTVARLNFIASASGGLTIQKVKVRVTNISATPTYFRLMEVEEGIMHATTAVVTDGVVTFNMTSVYAQGFDLLFSVDAVFANPGPANGSKMKLELLSAEYVRPNNTTVTVNAPAALQVEPHFYTALALIVPSTTDQSQLDVTYGQSGLPTMLTTTFKGLVIASGGTVPIIPGSDIQVEFIDLQNGHIVLATGVSAVMIPNNPVSDGTAAQFLITANLPGGQLQSGGIIMARVKSVKWTAGSNTVTQDWGFERFKTNAVAINTVEFPQILETTYSNGEFVIKLRSKSRFVSFQQSTNGLTWSPATELGGTGIVSQDGAGWIVYQGTLDAPTSAPRKFFRALVEY